MAVVGVARNEHLTSPLAPRPLLAVAYLTLFGSLLGFSAYSYLLKHTRPAVATSYAYVNPLIAVVIGVVVAHEHFGATSFAGAMIVLAAVALVGRSMSRARSAEPRLAKSATAHERPVLQATGECFSQREARSMQARLHVRHADVENLRDLLRR
jgi:lysylphosphatidylglycerol synthetase-like protein (DUF2156 family)